MDEIRELLAALFSLIAMIAATALALIAAALIIGFWPLALLIAAGALFALARRAAGVRD